LNPFYISSFFPKSFSCWLAQSCSQPGCSYHICHPCQVSPHEPVEQISQRRIHHLSINSWVVNLELIPIFLLLLFLKIHISLVLFRAFSANLGNALIRQTNSEPEHRDYIWESLV
jgi:hypothetical protein